ncbi:MAG: SRPBCC domain-containing protein [Chitinophagaceae bacterium]
MEKVIRHQFFFAHPPEIVWEYLTNPALMELWLMKNNFQLALGAEFQFRTGAAPALNFDGIFHCKVLEIVPFKKLSYSWGAGPGNGEIQLDSVVVWKVEATEKGTDVVLEHRGFAKVENLEFYNGLNQGWVEKFEKIAKLLKDSDHANTNA